MILWRVRRGGSHHARIARLQTTNEFWRLFQAFSDEHPGSPRGTAGQPPPPLRYCMAPGAAGQNTATVERRMVAGLDHRRSRSVGIGNLPRRGVVL